MKVLLGILSILVVLTGAILTLVSMWDIYPISWVFVLKAGLTVLIVSTAVVLLWLISKIFFPKDILNKNK
jgi:hypothetical protein